MAHFFHFHALSFELDLYFDRTFPLTGLQEKLKKLNPAGQQRS